jgi:hypothetical protein
VVALATETLRRLPPMAQTSIAIGVTTGAGEHTEQEWIDLADLPAGLAVLADTVSNLDNERW